MSENVPSEFDDFLNEPRNGILCISRGESDALEAPHATPVWFDYSDGFFRVSITRRRVKYRLLQAQPVVTLVIDDASSYRTVVITGRAEIIEDENELLTLRKRLHEKYEFGDRLLPDDELLHSLREEGRVVVSITPENVLSWAGG